MSKIEEKIDEYIQHPLGGRPGPVLLLMAHKGVALALRPAGEAAKVLRNKVSIFYEAIDKAMTAGDIDDGSAADMITDLYQDAKKFGIEDLIDFEDTPAGPLHPRL